MGLYKPGMMTHPKFCKEICTKQSYICVRSMGPAEGLAESSPTCKLGILTPTVPGKKQIRGTVTGKLLGDLLLMALSQKTFGQARLEKLTLVSAIA